MKKLIALSVILLFGCKSNTSPTEDAKLQLPLMFTGKMWYEDSLGVEQHGVTGGVVLSVIELDSVLRVTLYDSLQAMKSLYPPIGDSVSGTEYSVRPLYGNGVYNTTTGTARFSPDFREIEIIQPWESHGVDFRHIKVKR